jgi:hypothetical protein
MNHKTLKITNYLIEEKKKHIEARRFKKRMVMNQKLRKTIRELIIFFIAAIIIVILSQLFREQEIKQDIIPQLNAAPEENIEVQEDPGKFISVKEYL